MIEINMACPSCGKRYLVKAMTRDIIVHCQHCGAVCYDEDRMMPQLGSEHVEPILGENDDIYSPIHEGNLSESYNDFIESNNATLGATSDYDDVSNQLQTDSFYNENLEGLYNDDISNPLETQENQKAPEKKQFPGWGLTNWTCIFAIIMGLSCVGNAKGKAITGIFLLFILALVLIKIIPALRSIFGTPRRFMALSIVMIIIFGVSNRPCEHEWEESIILEATCTQQGALSRECIHCGETVAETIAMKGHSNTETILLEATCDTEGESLTVCTVCGYEEQAVIPALGHTNEDIVIAEATCESDGQLQSTCTTCGYVQTSVISSAGHQNTRAILLDATCDADGQEHLTCSVCGHVEKNVIAMRGHLFQAANCTAPQTCLVCDLTVGEPLGHTIDIGLCYRCGDEVKNLRIAYEGEPEIAEGDPYGASIYEVVHANNATVKTYLPEYEFSDGSKIISLDIICINDGSVVDAICEGIAALGLERMTEVFVLDADNQNGLYIYVAKCYGDGTITVVNESNDLNTPRNKWVKSIFSSWDGSVDEFEKMIKKRLKDESSYKHIETRYININTDEKVEENNKKLKNAGSSARVKRGDIILVTEFSAKNAFNATVKNTAYGIASYEDRSLTLIAIE